MSLEVAGTNGIYYVPPIINQKGKEMTEEAEKELRRFKKYSAALEEEIKGLRFAMEEIGNSPLAYGAIVKIAKQALKGG